MATQFAGARTDVLEKKMKHEEKLQPQADRLRAMERNLDNDTVDYGTHGPFETWDSDSTALVHVLWNAKHDGLTLQDDADEIAARIMASRWLAANRSKASA